MMIELICRFQTKKKKSPVDEEQEYIDSLINPDRVKDNSSEFEIIYDPICLDFEDIIQIIKFDKIHTQVNLSTGQLYVIKMFYSDFLDLYTQVTGKNIMKIKYKAVEKESRPLKEIEISPELDSDEHLNWTQE